MTTQTTTPPTAQPIVENHQGFNGDNHWFLCRFATRWAYREQTPLGLVEAGTDLHGDYWAGLTSADHCIFCVIEHRPSLVDALGKLAGRLAMGHGWQPPIDALAELIGDD